MKSQSILERSDYMKKFLKSQTTEFYLLIGSMFFLTLLGIFLNYNYNLYDNYNLLFDSDTGRVMLDSTIIAASHYRLDVHPLFVLIIQPLVFIIKGLVINRLLAIIILSALASSLTVVYIYRILKLVGLKEKTSILLSLLYLFSFSNIIFTSGIETYNFAAFFLVLLWYYFIKNKEKELDNKSYILLGILGVLSFSMTITNYCVFLIVCFVLWIFKKAKFKKLFIMGILTVVSLLALNLGQRLIWNNTPVLWNLNPYGEASLYGDTKLGLKNIKNVVDDCYINSVISNDVYLKVNYGSEYNEQNYMITFNETSYLQLFLFLMFYGVVLIITARNYKKNKIENTALVLTIIFNSVLHTVYGNDSPFLYSLHFLYLIFLLLGINLAKEENKKVQKYSTIFLIVFLILELLQNTKVFINVLKYVDGIINKNYLLANLPYALLVLVEIIVVALTIIFIVLIFNLVKKIVKEKDTDKKLLIGAGVVTLLVITNWIYIALESPKDTNRFLGFHLKGNDGVVEKQTKTNYISKDFKERFKSELESLKEYQDEYNEFKSTHNVEETDYVNWQDYYYFGMGNREKYIYLEGQIKNINTNEIVYSFEEKEHYIIPNLYTVLVQTKDNEFIEIKETEDGVYYNDKVLPKTNIKINLYDFKNDKYKNMKKVLYGEILFNIKDSKIYPNIVVYKDAWYRDAALTCMVLKQTNNTDLITDWVSSIEDIYDRQNNGVEEPDNLGELLYILSTQKEIRYDLVDKIEKEAERLASSNPNGYYIYGKTDFGDQYLYQNLWYKLGLESIGKTYPYDLKSIKEDSYSKMAWWSDYEVSDKSPYNSEKFYPYLSYGAYHKLGSGTLPVNRSLYPLSWETSASSANYNNYQSTMPIMRAQISSPLHSWSASELLLLLLDETGELQFA